MITIEFLEDENGQQQVADLIDEIVKKASKNEDYAEIAARIAQVLDYLEEIGIPPEHLRTLQGESTKGHVITLTDVVKELDNHPPLLEFRVNWPPIGAFRAIFFYEEDSKGKQTIYFTKAVIKNRTYSPEFENAIRASEKMLKKFMN